MFINKVKIIGAQGLKVLRESVEGIEFMAGKTVDYTRLQLQNQKEISRLKELFTEFGQRVYNAISSSKTHEMKPSADLMHFLDRIKKVQDKVEANTHELKRIKALKRKKKE